MSVKLAPYLPIVLLFATGASGQPDAAVAALAACPVTVPTSRVEDFQSRTGVALLRQTSMVGGVTDSSRRTVSLRTIVVRETGDLKNLAAGVRLSFPQGSVYVDDDEIDVLLQAMEAMLGPFAATNRISVTTRAGFSMAIQPKPQTINWSIAGKNVYSSPVSLLTDFRDLLVTARTRLQDSTKQDARPENITSDDTADDNN